MRLVCVPRLQRRVFCAEDATCVLPRFPYRLQLRVADWLARWNRLFRRSPDSQAGPTDYQRRRGRRPDKATPSDDCLVDIIGNASNDVSPTLWSRVKSVYNLTPGQRARSVGPDVARQLGEESSVKRMSVARSLCSLAPTPGPVTRLLCLERHTI